MKGGSKNGRKKARNKWKQRKEGTYQKKVDAIKAAKTEPEMPPSTLTKKQLRKFRRILEEKRINLQSKIKIMSLQLKQTLRTETENGKLKVSTHIADIVPEDLIVDETIINKMQKILTKIDEALQRIEKGTYGICLGDNCHQPINPKRFEATPFAVLCCACKEKTEKKERQARGEKHSHLEYSRYAFI